MGLVIVWAEKDDAQIRLKAFREAAPRAQSSPGRPQKLHIKCSICPFYRLLFGLLFSPSGKHLNFLHFFPAKTGTSPANSLTERRARFTRARRRA
jgi:hypothetical protein